MGMILVTHNFGVVADICDRVAVMQKGQIVETADARELFARPRHEYTQMLLASTLENSEPRTLVFAGAAGMSAQPLPVPTPTMTPTAPSRRRAADHRPGRRRVPVQGLAQAAVPRPQGRLVRDPRGRDARPGRRVRLGQDHARPRGPRPRARDRRRDPATTAGASTGSAPRERRAPRSRAPGRLPGPLHLAQPGDDHQRHPDRAAARRRRRPRGRQPAGAGAARPVHLPADAGQRLPREFSGGQRQRVAIARALSRSPQADRLRRAGQRARPVDPGARARPVHRDPGAHGRRLPVHHPRPVGRAAHQPPRRGDATAARSSRPAMPRRSRSAPEHPYTQRLLLASPVADPVRQEQRRAERHRFMAQLAEQDEQAGAGLGAVEALEVGAGLGDRMQNPAVPGLPPRPERRPGRRRLLPRLLELRVLPRAIPLFHRPTPSTGSRSATSSRGPASWRSRTSRPVAGRGRPRSATTTAASG